MTEYEKSIIKAFALKDRTAADDPDRIKALEIYYKYLRDEKVRETDEFRFMSEIDNPCPCHILKKVYRDKIIK